MLGLYFRCRSWSRSNYWSYFALTETVGNTQAQHAVVRTSADGVCVTDVVGPLVFQTGSDFRSDRILNTASEDRRNAGVVVFKGCATRYVSLGVCTPYHTTQTSVDVQIVSDWVTQFSGQLNALSFVCAVDVVAFVRHTT